MSDLCSCLFSLSPLISKSHCKLAHLSGGVQDSPNQDQGRGCGSGIGRRHGSLAVGLGGSCSGKHVALGVLSVIERAAAWFLPVVV